MNKEQLEIAKRIAEIEGVKFECTDYNKSFPSPLCALKSNGYEYWEYNPFNWDILGSLMVKHDISIDYVNETADIFNEEKDEYLFWESFSGKEDIPRAILKCIITSKE